MSGDHRLSAERAHERLDNQNGINGDLYREIKETRDLIARLDDRLVVLEAAVASLARGGKARRGDNGAASVREGA